MARCEDLQRRFAAGVRREHDLRAVVRVFEDFRYVQQIRDGDAEVLRFAAQALLEAMAAELAAQAALNEA